MFNVILFADTPEAFSKTRGYGAQRLHDPSSTHTEELDITRNSADSIFAQKLTTALTDNTPEPYFDLIKQINPKVKLTLGGSKIGMYTDMKMIDHIFVGYSETMVIDFLHSISGKGPRRIFNKMIDHDQKAQEVVDLNASIVLILLLV